MVLVVFILYLLTLSLVVLLPASDAKLVTGSVGIISDPLGSFGMPRQGSEICVEFLLNIVLFVPFGFFARLFSPSRAPACVTVISGMVTSCFIEMLQMVVPGRVTAFSDIVANAIGTWGGVLCVRMLRRVQRCFPPVTGTGCG